MPHTSGSPSSGRSGTGSGTGTRTGTRSRRPAEVLADAVRVLAGVSVVVALLRGGAVDAALFFMVLGGTVIPRLLRVVPPGLDAAFGAGLLVAAWSGSLGLYEQIGWLDLAVHGATTALAAAVGYLAMVRAGWLVHPRETPAMGVVVVTVLLGLSLSVLWEQAEYLGATYLDPTIYVAYVDTIGDMTLGGLGSAVAGMGLGAWARRTARDRTA